MRLLIASFLAALAVAAPAAVNDPTNIRFFQRDGDGANQPIDVLGSDNEWSVMGFNASGVFGPLTLTQLLAQTPITGSTITDGSVVLADLANLAQGKIIGRASSGTGVPEAVTVSSGDFSLSGGTMVLQPVPTSLAGELQSIGGLTSAADKLPYYTGADTAALADFSSFGRTLVDDASASAARTTLGLAIGTDVAPAGAIVLRKATGAVTGYLPGADTDAARGTALITALAAAAAGDTIILGPGNHTTTTTQLVLPAGSSLIGQGWGTTTITGQKMTHNLLLATGVTIQGVKIVVNTPSNSSGHSIIGNTTTPYTDVTIRDCWIIGEQDIANGFGEDNNTTIRVVDSILETKFDTFNHTPGTGNQIDIEGCTIIANGAGNPDSSAGIAGLSSVAGVTLNVRDTIIYMGDAAASPGTGGNAVVVTGGTANLRDVIVSRISGSGAGTDLLRSGAGTLNVTGGVGTGTNGAFTTSGTITYVGSDYAAAAAGLSDGDKGDVTVSASGATWTIDASGLDSIIGSGRHVTFGDVFLETITFDSANFSFDSGTGNMSLAGTISFPDNFRQTFNPGAAVAGVNVGAIAGDPSTPTNGDLWYDSTANELTARINGASVALGAGGGTSLDALPDGQAVRGATTASIVFGPGTGAGETAKLVGYDTDGAADGTVGLTVTSGNTPSALLSSAVTTTGGSAIGASQISFSVDGGGSAITTGTQKAKVVMPYAGTITRVTVLADTSTSTTCDIWKDTYANYPPTIADTIVASAKPTLSAATKSQDSTLTGWTTSLAAGDVLYFTVDTNNNATHLDIILDVTR